MYVAYKTQTQFFLVYISEAHPDIVNTETGKAYGQPKTVEGRAVLAQKCITELRLSIPVLMDTTEGAAEKAYQGRPDRICIVDLDGKVAYYSRRGPRGFKPKEAEQALKGLFAKHSRIVTDRTSEESKK